MFDNEGALSLLVDRHKVDCRIIADTMLLSARICGLPVDDAERRGWLCRVLTLTNRHARNRREFPVLSEKRTLQLHTRLNPNMDYEAFTAQFQRFMDALDAWRQAILPLGGVDLRMPPNIGDKPLRHPSHTVSTGFL
jgi:hypothetical protein